jgi:hypothetical protein
MWTEWNWIKMGTVAGCFKYVNEPSVSINGGGFLALLCDYQLLKRRLCSVKIVKLTKRALFDLKNHNK